MPHNNIPNEIAAYCIRTVGKPESFLAASGGCINNGGTIQTPSGSYFIKWNTAKGLPKMFSVEAKGLQLLSLTEALPLPKVVGCYEGESYSCLLLENIKQGHKAPDHDQMLAEGLAKIHQTTNNFYGLDHNNYMGSLPQRNAQMESWVDFFITQRILPQLEIANRQNRIPKSTLQDFELLFKRLSNILTFEKPALVHGDLWGGNVMCNEDGAPTLIDPAVSFAHREVDIAMTLLFGGFSEKFYNIYNEIMPMHEGWKLRCDIYNLYPLLVHVNLFGGGYLSQVKLTLKQFS